MQTETSPRAARPRNPRTASRLSRLGYGFGQIYCGHLVRGLTIYAISIVMLVAWIMLIALMKGRFLQAVVIGLVPFFVLGLFARIDARRLAARAPSDYTPREYNHWSVYAVLWGIIVALAVCGAFVVREMAYEAFDVVTASMAPTIPQGNRVLVDKTIYEVAPMQRGDVVIVRSPGRRRNALVKRLVALPGDEVEMRGGRIVAVNGVTVGSSDALPATTPTSHPASDTSVATVPKDYGYFMSDNPAASADAVVVAPLSSVVGRVEFIYWPRVARVKSR